MSSTKDLKNMELIVSTVLQLGVIISSVIILIGVSLFYIHGHQNKILTQPYQHFTDPSFAFPHSIKDLETSLGAGNGIAYIELGVLLLILTPVIRVATSILIFLRQHDKPMTAVTFVVLLVLISSFVLGLAVK